MGNENKERFLYLIYNTCNGKLYVGITVNTKQRWYRHKYVARNIQKKSDEASAIHYAMNKWGVDNFVFKIVDNTNNLFDANNKEKLWIKELKQLGYQLYNETDGGDGVIGYTGIFTLSDEARKKLSERMSGKNNYFYGKQLFGKDNGNYGKSMKPHVKAILKEHNCKISDTDVKNIRDMFYNQKISQTKIAANFSLEISTINQIVYGHRRNDGSFPVKTIKPQLKPEQVIEMRELYSSGNWTYEKLGEKYNISLGQVCRIIKRQKWTKI